MSIHEQKYNSFQLFTFVIYFNDSTVKEHIIYLFRDYSPRQTHQRNRRLDHLGVVIYCIPCDVLLGN